MKKLRNRRVLPTPCCLVLLTIATVMGGHAADQPPGTLVWNPIGGARVARLPVAATGQSGFAWMLPSSTGISFTNRLAEEHHLTNQILLNGSGVTAGDVDGDGWCDLYFCGLDGPNALFRNRGQWKFDDITARAGVAGADVDATGAAFADLDGDGDLDLLVNSLGSGTHLFLNDGQAHFTEFNPTSRLNAKQGGMSLALADIDGDGDLDLYVANYRTVTIRDQPNTKFTLRPIDGQPQVVSVNGRRVSEPELVDRFTYEVTARQGSATFTYDEHGEPDALFRNDGAGRFSAVSWTNGAFLDEAGQPLRKPAFDWGLSAMFRDLNGDGAPDLYVCNDFKSPDRIWLNDGQGNFRALPALALRQTSLSSMGVDFADINRDGFDDFLVVDMLSREHSRRFSQRIDLKPESWPIGAITNRPQSPRNTLFLNRGDGTWAECAQLSGLDASEWSWTPVFLDVDLDGYEDLLISNGFERDGMNVDALQRIEQAKKQQALPTVEQLRLRRMFPRLATPNLAFRNLGGLRFQEVSAQWGFNSPGVSHGLCLADLDNDGDLDVALNNLNSVAGLYRNEASASRIAVRLRGLAPNTRGIGAKIKVLGGPVPQSQEMICGGRYLSSDDALRTFAAGALTNRLTIEVLWRSGRRSVVQNAQANHLYEIDEAGSSSSPAPSLTAKPPHFIDVSRLLQHAHHEDAFDDFAVQPTLPRRFSQLGPGVSWFDLDGDGWDDLLIGSGKGGRLAAFRNDARGGFTRWEEAPFQQPVTRDQTSILGWRKPDGQAAVLAGSANYEDGLAAGSSVRQFNLATRSIEETLPGMEASTGPLAMADVDGDGQLDLFVGGRVRPGHYPQAVASMIFRGQGGTFHLDRDNAKSLAQAGLVSGAVFSDLDGDGFPELILACEWGPLRVFHNQRGQFTEATERLGLARFTGWWNGVTTGDFDGDGRLDLAASNWGQNTRYESFRAKPLRMFYGAQPSGGVMQAIEGYVESATARLLPLQPFHVMGLAMPALRERLGTFEAYARSTLPEIYGDAWKGFQELQATTLESMIFLNRGDHFEARPLPLEAQLAPAFALCAADFNGDGAEDLFLSQNFFALPPDTSRYDAGRGLWLKGDGHGDFTAVSGSQSGLLIYGEQRGAAAGDFDGDGRTDLVVTQNGAETKLFRNTSARPGLRVRLRAAAGNPSAAGAALRLHGQSRRGPLREIHAGSGYWSQDSAVAVLHLSEPPLQLFVRWPGGREATTDLPPAVREVTVDVTGRLLESK